MRRSIAVYFAFWATCGVTLFQLAARRGSAVVNATIRVDCADVRALGLWLPRVMEEDYSGAVSLTGRANYSNYRKFSVVVDEKGQ